MNVILRWILYALLIMFAAWIVPGIHVSGFFAALFVTIIMALINTVVKPIVQVVTLPINILTLGLFSLVINALMFWLAGVITPGFEVEGFMAALFGSIVVALGSMGIERIGANDRL